MELREKLVLQAPRSGKIRIEFRNGLFCYLFIYEPDFLFSYLDISCQGEGGAAGENGASGPMVSSIFSFKCHCNAMQYRSHFVSELLKLTLANYIACRRVHVDCLVREDALELLDLQ